MNIPELVQTAPATQEQVQVVPVLVKSLGSVRKKPRQMFNSLTELCRHLVPVVELKVEARP